jgi:hypothetical protein
MTADRDTTLPRTPEQILSTLNLIGDKWLRERVLAALREAREGAERERDEAWRALCGRAPGDADDMFRESMQDPAVRAAFLAECVAERDELRGALAMSQEAMQVCVDSENALRSERDALAAAAKSIITNHGSRRFDLGLEMIAILAADWDRLRALASPGSAPVAPARDAERSGRLAAEERADALAEHVSDLVRYIGRVDQVSPADDLRSDECLDEWDDLRATVEEARRALAPVAPEGRETGDDGSIEYAYEESLRILRDALDGLPEADADLPMPRMARRAAAAITRLRPAPETPAPSGEEAAPDAARCPECGSEHHMTIETLPPLEVCQQCSTVWPDQGAATEGA